MVQVLEDNTKALVSASYLQCLSLNIPLACASCYLAAASRRRLRCRNYVSSWKKKHRFVASCCFSIGENLHKSRPNRVFLPKGLLAIALNDSSNIKVNIIVRIHSVDHKR